MAESPPRETDATLARLLDLLVQTDDGDARQHIASAALERAREVSHQVTEERVKAALEHAVSLARNTTRGNMSDEACVDWALRRFLHGEDTE